MTIHFLPNADRPLKVAYLAPETGDSERPGPSAIVWDMARELTLLGHITHVVAPSKPRFSTDPRIKIHTIDPPPSSNRWFGGQVWLSKRLADMAASLEVDILHTPEYLSSAVLKRLYPRAKVVLTVPGNIYQRLSEPDGNQSSRLYTETIKWAARVSAKKCDAIIAFSREMYDWWARIGTTADRLTAIPYGVDISHYYRRFDSRQTIGLDGSVYLYLYVGRLDKEKGLFEMIEAFKRIRHLISPDGKNPSLSLVGDGPLKNELIRQIDSEGLTDCVRLHGPISRQQLPLWYSAADMLVLPSWIEPFGRVILESMACRTAVISSDTGGPRDHIVHMRSGLLFRRRDTNELAEMFAFTLHNPAKVLEMSEKAEEYVRCNLSWKSITNRIVDQVYWPLVGG